MCQDVPTTTKLTVIMIRVRYVIRIVNVCISVGCAIMLNHNSLVEYSTSGTGMCCIKIPVMYLTRAFNVLLKYVCTYTTYILSLYAVVVT